MDDVSTTRLAAVSGLLFLPLLAIGFGGLVGVSPTIDEAPEQIARYYRELDFGRAMAGEWMEVLGFAALLVFAARIAYLVRSTAAAWLGWLALAAAAALCAAVVGGVAPLLAAAYLGDHGDLPAEQYVVLNALRSGSHWLSSIFAGVWLAASAGALAALRAVPRWLVWGGSGIALLLLLGVAVPLSGASDLGQMLMGLWLVVVAGLLVLRPERGHPAVTAPAREDG